MVQHLFPNFHEDQDVYVQTEGYWRDLWREVLRDAGQENEWKDPWLNTSCVDGSRLMDGDPIFSAWCPSRNLAVRVVQYAPRKEDLDLSVNVTTFDPDVADIKVLEMFCALSEEAADKARDFLLSFVETGEVRLSRERWLAGLPATPAEAFGPLVVNVRGLERVPA